MEAGKAVIPKATYALRVVCHKLVEVNHCCLQAAGRHQCSYLISLQKQEFLLQGGDLKWLNGLNCIPQKLRNLYDINKILAHRPWLLNKSHIEVFNKIIFSNALFLSSCFN